MNIKSLSITILAGVLVVACGSDGNSEKTNVVTPEPALQRLLELRFEGSFEDVAFTDIEPSFTELYEHDADGLLQSLRIISNRNDPFNEASIIPAEGGMPFVMQFTYDPLNPTKISQINSTERGFWWDGDHGQLNSEESSLLIYENNFHTRTDNYRKTYNAGLFLGEQRSINEFIYDQGRTAQVETFQNLPIDIAEPNLSTPDVISAYSYNAKGLVSSIENTLLSDSASTLYLYEKYTYTPKGALATYENRSVLTPELRDITTYSYTSDVNPEVGRIYIRLSETQTVDSTGRVTKYQSRALVFIEANCVPNANVPVGNHKPQFYDCIALSTWDEQQTSLGMPNFSQSISSKLSQ